MGGGDGVQLQVQERGGGSVGRRSESIYPPEE